MGDGDVRLATSGFRFRLRCEAADPLPPSPPSTPRRVPPAVRLGRLYRPALSVVRARTRTDADGRRRGRLARWLRRGKGIKKQRGKEKEDDTFAFV